MENTLHTAVPKAIIMFIHGIARKTARSILHNKRFAADDEDVAQSVLMQVLPNLVPVPGVPSRAKKLIGWTVHGRDGLHPNFEAYVRLCARHKALDLLRLASRAEEKHRKLVLDEAGRSLDELLSLRSILMALEAKERQLLIADARGELQGASVRVRQSLSRARRKARHLGAELD